MITRRCSKSQCVELSNTNRTLTQRIQAFSIKFRDKIIYKQIKNQEHKIQKKKKTIQY